MVQKWASEMPRSTGARAGETGVSPRAIQPRHSRGAAELSRHCTATSRTAQGVFYSTTLLVGLSRIDANAHNAGQVAAGALVGMTAGSMRFGISLDRLGVRIGIEF
ncbi:hypothetical protein C9E81_12130 [Paracoccus alkanivorans]|uniref:Phosphatase PAP2 family protein n=1 Tax=Paracoccus alkanivorans TaxID=2116655 RepID=A0A3M0MAL4_9RHOB|nr:hypothetical protein C9E81_12130 [Paracoccus alkanivorans]